MNPLIAAIAPTLINMLLQKFGGDFFSGSEDQYKQLSKLGPEQQQLFNQLLQAISGQGAGGAFGDAADYWRNLLSNESQDFDAFAAPEMRRFREQTIPDLAEQFAGMGSGALSSSGFRNAAVSAGTDLEERLGAIRAGLRSKAAESLAGLGQSGLNPYYENIYEKGTSGFSEGIQPTLSNIAAQQFGQSGFGTTDPYGNQKSYRITR